MNCTKLKDSSSMMTRNIHKLLVFGVVVHAVGSNKRVWVSPRGDETLSPPGDNLWVLVASKDNTFPRVLHEVKSPMV